jgi:HNH endonuclease
MSEADPIESFRTITGLIGYEFSDLGRIRSYWSRDGSGRLLDRYRYLKPTSSHRGRYLKVTLKQGDRYTQRTVHSLIAEAFLGPPPEGKIVCHRDNDGTNNRLSNLRYDSPKGNAEDRSVHGTENRGSRNGKAKLTEADVMEIRRRLAAGDKQQAIADDYGVGQWTISWIKTGRYWTHTISE